jgi:hypothetical protein
MTEWLVRSARDLEWTDDGEEVPLRRWDYFHCPREVPHVVAGADEEPARKVPSPL